MKTLVFFALAQLPTLAAADVHTWDGGGVFERWDSSVNWVGNNKPIPGDDLVWLENGFVGYETDNDFPSGTSFRSIACTSRSFDNTNPGTSGWVHHGNLVVLGSGGLLISEAGGGALTKIGFPVRLGANQSWVIDSHVQFTNDGTIDLNNRNLVIDAGPGFRSFATLNAPISGPGDILISGTNVNLHAANTFFGTLDIDTGSVHAYHAGSLGSTDGPTIVGGILSFRTGGTVAEPIHLANTIFLAEGAPSFTGPWTVEGVGPTLKWFEDAGSLVTHSGGQSGTADLTLVLEEGANKIFRYTGSTPNTLTGSTTLSSPGSSALDPPSALTLELDKISATSLAGPLVVNHGTSVKWLRSSQCGPNVSLTLEAGGVAEMNGHNDTVADLHLLGGELLPEGGVLSVRGDIEVHSLDPTEIEGTLRMLGNAAPHGVQVEAVTSVSLFGAITESSALGSTVVRKTGGGFFGWSGASGIDVLEVAEGDMRYRGTAAGMDVGATGGSFEASGTVRDVTASLGSTVSPVLGSGEDGLSVRNLVLDDSATLKFFVGDDDFEPIVATGTVQLGSAQLNLKAQGVDGGIGAPRTILRKDSAGPVNGTFAGLPEGGERVVTGTGYRYRISYRGGDGNDVTATLVSVPQSGSTRIWTGFAAVPNLSHPQNWNPQSAPLPGDVLVFPDVIRKNLLQDLGPHFPIASLRFTSDGYHLTGQPLGVMQKIEADFPSGEVRINAPLRLGGTLTISALNDGNLRLGTIDVFSLDLNGHDLTLHCQQPVADGGLPTLHIGDPAPAFQPFTGIFGTGSISKTGAGFAAVECFCEFTGPVRVEEGRFGAFHVDALGASGVNNRTRVFPGATLDLLGAGGNAFEEDFVLEGTIRPVTSTFRGEVTLVGEVPVHLAEPGPGSASQFHGRVIGDANSSLRKTGPGNLFIGVGVISGLIDPADAVPNIIPLLTVEEGLVGLKKSPGVAAVSSARVTGGTLRLLENFQIASALTANLTVTGGGVFDFGPFDETLHRLEITGGTITGAAGSSLTVKQIVSGGTAAASMIPVPVTFTAGANINLTDGAAADDLIFSSTVAGVAGATVAKSGAGQVRFNAAESAPLQVLGGKAAFMGGGGAQVMLAGGAAGGVGPVGTISGAGRVEPGLSPGTLASGSLTWGASTTFAPEILNGTAGTGYDQMNVTGTVSLGGATLETTVLAGAALPSGTVLKIIENDGADAVTGTFAGLADGAVFAAGGKTFRIDYDGAAGGGNDVTLTVVTLGTGVARVWDGETSNQWAVAANWVNLPGNPPSAPSPGDDLIFPAGAANLSMTNNFPAGTVFNSIAVQAAGYTLGGSNAVQLNAGMNFEQPTGLTTIHLPVTFAGPQAFTVTAAGSAQFSGGGAITNNGHPLTLEVAGGSILLTGLTGSGGISKTGPGNLAFGISNTFTGPVTISSGTASIAAPVAGAGTGTAAYTIAPGATLNFSSTTGTFAKPITLGGRLSFSNTSVTLSGAITLPSGNEGLIDALSNSAPVIAGSIGGPGRLEKRQSGPLVLSGAGANTYTGGTTVSEGTLRLQKTAGVNAVPGALTIGDGAGADAVTLLAANQISDGAEVAINAGTLQCGVFDERIATLRMTGGSVTGSSTLHVDGISSSASAATATVDLNIDPGERHDVSAEDGAALVDLLISGEWEGSATLDVTRVGEGTVVFAGNGIANSLQLDGGLTRIHRDWNGVAMRLNGGTLGGSGPVGQVEPLDAGGGIAPGASAGILTTGSLLGNERMVMTFEIGGTTPDTEYDQLDVSGAVDLLDTELRVEWLLGFTPLIGDSFTLISNDDGDAVASTFRGVEEGTEQSFGPVVAVVSYKGGDGNDVTLTVVRYLDSGAERVWDGGGADDNWTTAANWRDDLAPVQGDSLVFPEGAARLAPTNGFPPGTNFARIRVGGAGYSFTGARVALNSGMEFDFPAGSAHWAIPVDLTQPQVWSSLAGNAIFAAAAALDNGGHALTINANTGTFDLLGAISGSGGLIKTGPSNSNLFAANSHTGTTAINQGQLTIFSNAAFGSGALVVQPGGRLQLASGAGLVLSTNLTVRGTVGSFVAAHRINGTFTVPTGATARIEVGSHRLDLGGRVQGAGALVKSGPGELGLVGTLPNTITGGLAVLEGGMIAGKAPNTVSIPGPLSIGDGSATACGVLLAADQQIADAAAVRISGPDAALDLGENSEAFADLEMTGGLVTTGGPPLTLTGSVTTQAASTTAVIAGNLTLGGTGLRPWTVADGPAATDLELQAASTGAATGTLQKLGDGVLEITAPGGGFLRAQADAGRLRFSSDTPLFDVDLNGAILEGTGALGNITGLPGGGTISPGLSPGLLTVESLFLNPASRVRFELQGLDAGSGYDQLVCAGSYDLGEAALDLVLGFDPPVDSSFTLVSSTAGEPTLSPFQGLPQGSYYSVPGGVVFQIDYKANDGDDVTLTRIEAAAPQLVSISVAPGVGPESGLQVVDAEFLGLPGVGYLLETSEDLLVWNPRAIELADPAGRILIHELIPGTQSRFFLRLGLP